MAKCFFVIRYETIESINAVQNLRNLRLPKIGSENNTLTHLLSLDSLIFYSKTCSNLIIFLNYIHILVKIYKRSHFWTSGAYSDFAKLTPFRLTELLTWFQMFNDIKMKSVNGLPPTWNATRIQWAVWAFKYHWVATDWFAFIGGLSVPTQKFWVIVYFKAISTDTVQQQSHRK